MKRRLGLLLAATLLVPAVAAAPGAIARSTATAQRSCVERVLVLASLPAEVDPLLAAAKLGPGQPVTRSGRHFFVGTLEGHPVIIGMVGIGLVNAQRVAEAAFDGFRCGAASEISSVVYSGVAGGAQGARIGDVTVPARWTLDNGKTWMTTDPAMLSTASAVVSGGSLQLEKTAPLGSPGCACSNPDLVKTVTFPYQPRVIIGGSGQSYDTFGGHEFPCVPGGGDIFGCEPCPYVLQSVSDAPRAATDMAGIIGPQFFLDNLQPASPSEKNYEVSDNETASADQVAVAHGVAFIAFRAISDGSPDPLMLPGYPSQFFAYYQLAADNAAHTALAFLRAWRTPRP
jgi:nucleoside phosphorylase